MKKPDYESIGAIDALLGFAFIILFWALVIFCAFWLIGVAVAWIVSLT